MGEGIKGGTLEVRMWVVCGIYPGSNGRTYVMSDALYAREDAMTTPPMTDYCCA